MKSIKELREQDARRLAERLAADPTPAELEEARKTMRSFYRLAAAYQREFYIRQERTATEAEKTAAEEKLARAYQKAKTALAKYNLKICFPGLYPDITENNGANFTRGWWY